MKLLENEEAEPLCRAQSHLHFPVGALLLICYCTDDEKHARKFTQHSSWTMFVWISNVSPVSQQALPKIYKSQPISRTRKYELAFCLPGVKWFVVLTAERLRFAKVDNKAPKTDSPFDEGALVTNQIWTGNKEPTVKLNTRGRTAAARCR